MKFAITFLFSMLVFASLAHADLDGTYRGDLDYNNTNQPDPRSCVVADAQVNVIIDDESVYVWIEGECDGALIYENEFFELAGNTVSHDGEMCGTFSQNAFDCRDVQGGVRTWSLSRIGDVLTFSYKGYLDSEDGSTEIRGRLVAR